MTATSRFEQPQAPATPVIDYEGSPYRHAFWEGQGRDYEDAVERLAIQRLLPPCGPRLAEIGAGFGRLANLYLGYDQIVLFDYSRTLLQDAVRQWGADPRFVFVAGDLYQLPLATGSLDSLVMVRVMHHLADVPRALWQLQRALHRHSVAVLEYANKRNLKAMARWLAGRQRWSPLALEPVEFVPLNFDFHPQWMAARLGEAGLAIRRQLAVSHFRTPFLKERLAADRLAQMDQWLFTLGGRLPLSPSVFLQAQAPGAATRAVAPTDPAAVAQLFRCPACGAEDFEMGATKQLSCRNCNTIYFQSEGIWDFKNPAVV
jgi:SAM-dependent methyltransferase